MIDPAIRKRFLLGVTMIAVVMTGAIRAFTQDVPKEIGVYLCVDGKPDKLLEEKEYLEQFSQGAPTMVTAGQTLKLAINHIPLDPSQLQACRVDMKDLEAEAKKVNTMQWNFAGMATKGKVPIQVVPDEKDPQIFWVTFKTPISGGSIYVLSRGDLSQVMANNFVDWDTKCWLAMSLSEEDLIKESLNACVNNMRIVDSGKEQAAMAYRLKDGNVVETNQVNDYVRHGTTPVCGGGGIYTYGKVGVEPQCSVHGTLSEGNAKARQK